MEIIIIMGFLLYTLALGSLLVGHAVYSLVQDWRSLRAAELERNAPALEPEIAAHASRNPPLRRLTVGAARANNARAA